MKFDKFIRKTYTLLEQSDQQGAPQPPQQGTSDAPNSSDVSSEVEKVGKKMGSQVETAEEELYTMSKDLVKIISQALQADNVDLTKHPKLKQIIDALNDACSSADAKTGLPQVQQAIKSFREDVVEKDQPFNF